MNTPNATGLRLLQNAVAAFTDAYANTQGDLYAKLCEVIGWTSSEPIAIGMLKLLDLTCYRYAGYVYKHLATVSDKLYHELLDDAGKVS